MEHRTTVRAIRTVARRAPTLEAEAAEHERDLEELVLAACPQLLDQAGVGVITAAQFLVSWSHAGRLRDEAAFAMLADVAPIPASSGKTVRHRLNGSSDRQLNRALHTVAPVPPAARPCLACYPSGGRWSHWDTDGRAAGKA